MQEERAAHQGCRLKHGRQGRGAERRRYGGGQMEGDGEGGGRVGAGST